MENEKLKELHKKIGDCIYNIESGTFEHFKVCYTPHCLRTGQTTQGQQLVELSRKRLHDLIDEFYETKNR